MSGAVGRRLWLSLHTTLRWFVWVTLRAARSETQASGRLWPC